MQVTPRALLGIIRLSQAVACLHFRNIIHKEDIDEALRLIASCTNSIMNETIQVGGNSFIKIDLRNCDPISDIFKILKELFMKYKSFTLKVSTIEKEISAQGYTKEEMEECLTSYISISALEYDTETKEIHYLGKLPFR